MIKLDLDNLEDLIKSVDEDCQAALAVSGKDLADDLKAVLPIETGALHDSIDTKVGMANEMDHVIVGPRSDYTKVVGGQELDTYLYAGVENERLGEWMQTKMDDDQVLDDLAANLQGILEKRLQ